MSIVGSCLTAVHGVAVLPKYYCHPSFSVCEQAEKLEVLDRDSTVTSMTASIEQ